MPFHNYGLGNNHHLPAPHVLFDLEYDRFPATPHRHLPRARQVPDGRVLEKEAFYFSSWQKRG